MRTTIAAVLAVLALTACSGDDEPSGDGAAGSNTPTASQPAEQPPPRSVAEMMTATNCTGERTSQLYARETAQCTIGEDEVMLATFDTNDLRDQWLDVARQSGGVFVTGELWAAKTGLQETADTVAATLSGEVQ